MEHEHIRIDRKDGVATVTLDRPGTHNACSMSMWLALRDIFRALAHDGEARAIVLTGAGGDFCSGADVVKTKGSESFDGSHLGAMRQLAESVMAVHDCPVPVIVKVDGLAIGAGFGFGLALAGDLSMTKRMLDSAAASSLVQALETEAIAQTVNLGTEDLAEAFQAFRQKREPRFLGR